MQKLIFDNSNLNESYSGVTTPLTFSFARRAYSSVYKEFSRVVGTPEEKIRENWPMYDAMLAYICGKMYYNLLNWYKLISFIPGYRFNKEFLEKMLGVSKGVSYDPRNKIHGFKKIIELSSLIKQILTLLLQFNSINKNVKNFINNFDKEFKKANTINLEKFTDLELVEFYLFWEQRFASKWRITIVNDLAVMIATGILRKISKKWLRDKNNFLVNEYLSYIKNVESKKPGERLNRILYQIKASRAFSELFDHGSEYEITKKIYENKRFAKLKAAVEDYLTDYGDRSPNELKLESKTYLNNKELLIVLIKNQLPNLNKKPDVSADIVNHINIKDSLDKLGFLKKRIFMLLVNLSRDYIKNREAARLRRSQVFGFARKAFHEFGKRMTDHKYLLDDSNIFYLQVEEIIGVFNGTMSHSDLKSTVIQRRRELDNWNKVDVPRRIEIEDSVYAYELKKINQFKKVIKKNVTTKRILNGVTCSNGSNGGIVTGEALVMKSFDPKASYVGKILVTCQTDPGWTPVFPHLIGIIVERGGMLSHAAIVAREYGLPCITQVDQATDLIPNGRQILINVKDGSVSLQ